MLHGLRQFIVVMCCLLVIPPISLADFCTSSLSSVCESSWFCSNPFTFYLPSNKATCVQSCSTTCVHGCGFNSNGVCATCNKFCSGYCLVSASTACIASCAAGTSSAQCNGRPGCLWCGAFGGYCTASASCISSCSAANSDSILCSDTAGNCAWCSGIGGYCKQDSVVSGCPASCATITVQTLCSGVLPCGWCSSLGGYCKEDSAVPSCVSDCTVVSNSNVCDVVPPCGWCSNLGGYCKQNSAVPSCVADCTVVGSATCAAVAPCGWCTELGGYCRQGSLLPVCVADCRTVTSSLCQPTVVAKCSWCGQLGGYCKEDLVVPTCVTSCQQQLSQLICTGTAPCGWCTSMGGYCKDNTLLSACIDNCPGNASFPTVAQYCNAAQPCSWCDVSVSVGVCQPRAMTCHSVCLEYSSASDVCVASRACLWCASLGYCTERSDASLHGCASYCAALSGRPEVCGNASRCHLCPNHGGRCKAREGYGVAQLRWRGEVECATPSLTDSASSQPTSSGSTTDVVSVSRSEGSATEVASHTVTMHDTRSASPSAPSLSAVVSVSCSSNVTTVTSTRNSTPTTDISRSLSVTLSPGVGSVSASLPPTFSFTAHSSTKSTISLSQSFLLPPCSIDHVRVLRSTWPGNFTLRTTSAQVAAAGIPGALLQPDIHPPLLQRVPNLLRVTHMVGHARPIDASHNPLGFRHYYAINVTLTWRNGNSLLVGMPPLPRYTIDSDEEALIEVPFEAIVYCNRTDPSSVPGIPSMIALVSVTVKARYRVLSGLVAGSVLLAVAGGAIVSPTSSSSSTLRSVASFAECGEDENSFDLSGAFSLPLGDEPVEAALGAVLGNTAATVAVGTLLLMAALFLRCRETEPLKMVVAVSRVHLPSAMIVPLAGLIANNVSSAIFLVLALVSRDTTPVSPSAAIVCVFVVALLLVAHYYLLMSVCLQPLLTPVRREHAPLAALRDVGVLAFLKSRWLHLRRRQWKWEPSLKEFSSEQSAHDANRRDIAALWKWRHLITLQDTHTGWYPLLDGAVNAAAAVLSTVPWMVGNACFPAALSLALVQSAQLAVVVACRPHSSLFMHYFTCVATVLSCVTLLLSAWKGYLYQQLAQPPGDDSAEVVNLSTGILVTVLCSALLDIAKSMLDVIDLLVSIARKTVCHVKEDVSASISASTVMNVALRSNSEDDCAVDQEESHSSPSSSNSCELDECLEIGDMTVPLEESDVATDEMNVCTLNLGGALLDDGDSDDDLLPLRTTSSAAHCITKRQLKPFRRHGFSIVKAMQEFPAS